MPKLLERQPVVPTHQQPFSPPEWMIIPGYPHPTITPDRYLRTEKVYSGAFPPHTIVILDEQIQRLSRDTEKITQWILGHHPQILPLAKLHQGWQGPEMIRQFYRLKIVSPQLPHPETVMREIDLSRR